MEKVISKPKTTQAPQKKTSISCEVRTCQVHGEYDPVFVKSFDKSREIELGCQKCVEERNKNNGMNERILVAGIPKRFLGCSFENYQPCEKSNKNLRTMKAYHEKFHSIKENGTSAILCGLPGTGKTHLSCALSLALIKSGYYVKYTTSYKMLAHIKSTYGKSSVEHEDHVIKKYASCDLLIIDEVGVQFGTDAEKTLFYQIINGRYEDVLPTILISNEDESGVKAFIGERCFDRMKDGNGFVLSFDWESYRK